MAAALCGSAAFGQSLTLGGPLDTRPIDFSGPYLGGSFGLLTSGAPLTTSAVIGYNFVPTGNLLLGAELSGRLYNDTSANDEYMLHAKAGATFDNLAVYGIGGLGFDNKLGGQLTWDAGAGAEYGLTRHFSLVGQVLAAGTFSSMPSLIHGEVGFRNHFDSYRPYAQVDSGFTYPEGMAGVVVAAKTIGISEVRLGGAVSNIELSPYSMPFEPDLTSFKKARYDTITADVLFDSPWLLGWAGAPRPYIGGTFNVQGYESTAHAGLGWHWNLGDSPFYAELGGGLAVHNGYLDKAPAGYRNMGCRVLTEWQYGVGANVGENLTVTAEYQHISGYLFGCSPNEGANHFGVSAGWKF